MKYLQLILLLLFLSANILAQNKPKTEIIEVTGILRDIQTNEPVQYAHLINLKKGQATITDTSGHFRILMTLTDTIRISCIGYNVKFWGLDFTELDQTKFSTVIYLIPKTYQVAEVNIYRLRWNNFVYEVAHTQIERDLNPEKLTVYLDKSIYVYDLQALTISSRGVGFPLPFKTKREKQLIKVKHLKEESRLNDIAYKKYNRELVHSITGLENEEIDKFMKYCNFERDFIIETSQYDLIVIIKKIFDAYKNNNSLNNN